MPDALFAAAMLMLVLVSAGACNSTGGDCATKCAPSCAQGFGCLSSGTVAAACWPTCRTTDDCAVGSCLAVDNVNLFVSVSLSDGLSRVCAPKTAPLCSGVASRGRCYGGEHCADADTLSYPVDSNFGCAYEYVHCPNGCARPPDAGTGTPRPQCSP